MENTNMLEYTCAITPRTMRSKYWQYFGFPADCNTNILTRQKIICKICNAIIAYNSNTSNLRTHLIARHAEVLIPMQISNISSNHQKQHIHSKNSEIDNDVQDDDQVFNNDEVQDANNYADQDDDDGDDDDDTCVIYEDHQISNNDDNDGEMPRAKRKCHKQEEQKETEKKTHSERLEVDYECYPMAPKSLEIEKEEEEEPTTKHVAVLINNLLPCTYFECLKTFSSNVPNLPALQNEINIKFKKVQNSIKSKLTKLERFSLGIELYGEHENILGIYYNYLTCNNSACGRFKLQSQLYETRQNIYLNNETISNSLSNIDMTRCTGIVVSGDNYNDDGVLMNLFGILQQQQPNMPIFFGIEYVVHRMLENIFQISDIKNAICRLFNYINNNSNNNHYNELSEERILYHNNNAWSLLNYLHGYFVKNKPHLLSNNNNEKQFLDDMNNLLHYLYPLKIVLESSGKNEVSAYCTLMRPLLMGTFDMMENGIRNKSNKYVMAAYNKFIDIQNATNHLVSNEFFIEAAFFDRRFDFELEKIHDIQYNIKAKFQEIINQEQNETCPQPGKSSLTALQTYFEVLKQHVGSKNVKQLGNSNENHAKSNINEEIEKYFKNGLNSIGLNQCPMVWWEMHKTRYHILYKIALKYLTIPCCINRLYYDCNDPNERLSVISKRQILMQQSTHHDETNQQLWYLYYNK